MGELPSTAVGMRSSAVAAATPVIRQRQRHWRTTALTQSALRQTTKATPQGASPYLRKAVSVQGWEGESSAGSQAGHQTQTNIVHSAASRALVLPRLHIMIQARVAHGMVPALPVAHLCPLMLIDCT